MIKYKSGAFGFTILCRLHGSAVFKSIMPALLSSAIYLVLYHTAGLQVPGNELLDHPYPMGALIAAFTFLLSFRANFSYNRYWEAFGSVHGMHSKWLDVGIHLAAFHLQAARYNSIKPPSFGAHSHLTSLQRERERNEPTFQEIEKQIDETIEKGMETNRSSTSRFSRWLWKRRKQKKEQQRSRQSAPEDNGVKKFGKRSDILDKRIKDTRKSINAPPSGPIGPIGPIGPPKMSQKKKKHRRVVSSVRNLDSVTAHESVDEKPLFLQEAAHLLSLLSAVAMSTLRNDLETAESPLITFTPGAPFPCVDPDSMMADIREEWLSSSDQIWFPTLRFLFGLSRNEKDRSVYNAARPFRVYGGVSDNEVLLLQAARGPQAKVNLVSLWVQEFIAREYLAGSCGKIEPPIISRLFQYISDGCLHYNQARKVAYIPFPFPHAQITCLFVLVIVAFVPVLMLSFVTSQLLGFLLNLLTVMCFAGLHEVARELENPFQNAPNDLPANNLHGQYNEALMSMFTGYHPDAYWEVKEVTIVDDESNVLLEQVNSIDVEAIFGGLQGVQGTSPSNQNQLEPYVFDNMLLPELPEPTDSSS